MTEIPTEYPIIIKVGRIEYIRADKKDDYEPTVNHKGSGLQEKKGRPTDMPKAERCDRMKVKDVIIYLCRDDDRLAQLRHLKECQREALEDANKVTNVGSYAEAYDILCSAILITESKIDKELE